MKCKITTVNIPLNLTNISVLDGKDNLNIVLKKVSGVDSTHEIYNSGVSQITVTKIL